MQAAESVQVLMVMAGFVLACRDLINVFWSSGYRVPEPSRLLRACADRICSADTVGQV